MGKVTQVKNGKYIGADKYTITDTSDGKKQVVFSPDSVLEEGTPIGAEILNEIQKNGLYYLAGTHRVDGQESIYDCTLVGIDTFEFAQLNVLFKPNTTPTQATVKLNISGQVFELVEHKINVEQIGITLVKSEMKAYNWVNNKLDKGNVSENFNNAEKIVQALESNQGLKFDTILNIDDVGTKQEGYCYMFEGDIYKCIKRTEATTPESANFQPISNNKLSGRLDSLFENYSKTKKINDSYFEAVILEFYDEVNNKLHFFATGKVKFNSDGIIHNFTTVDKNLIASTNFISSSNPNASLSLDVSGNKVSVGYGDAKINDYFTLIATFNY